MRTQEEVELAFTHHPPRNEREIKFYERYREVVKETAMLLLQVLPDCPERTIAIRHLEQSVMYANAAVARRGLDLIEDTPVKPLLVSPDK